MRQDVCTAGVDDGAAASHPRSYVAPSLSEERMEKLERQDRSNCPILPVLDFMGHDAVCSR